MKTEAIYGKKYWILFAIGCFFTCGTFVGLMWYMRTMLIKEVDKSGVTTLSGRHFNWDALTRVEGTVFTAGGSAMGKATALIFDSHRAIVNSLMISNPAEVIEAIEFHTSRPEC